MVVGAIAGILANYIFPEPAQGGLLAAIGLGIVGAIVGGYLAGLLLKRDTTTGINVESIVTAIVGAVLVLAVWNYFF
jgi:uncharacterized membrane protein YeaQ/YmgE (transglycosylase-associated protein family)